MRRFCYKCGALEADAGPLIQGLCQRCFSETPLLEVPSEVEVVICKRCGTYKLGKQWRLRTPMSTIENVTKEIVLDKIRIVRLTESGTKLLRPTETSEVEVYATPVLKENLVKVRGVGKVHPLQVKPKSEEITVKFNLIYKTCTACSLKRARHHEAILQLRGELSREILSELRKVLESLGEQATAREPKDFIADVKEQHGGLDIYVSSVSLAKKMAALLKVRFGASVSESAKLIGQTRDGRKKYRISILAKFEKIALKR